MAKKLTSSKAREILHDKSVHGHPLTDKQRRFFGAIAGGAKPYKAQFGSFLQPITGEDVSRFFDLFSVPQKAATKLVTGKYQTPSQAMGIKNKAGAIATDILLDPVNLVTGVGALRQAVKFRPKPGMMYRQIFGEEALENFQKYGPTTRPGVEPSQQLVDHALFPQRNPSKVGEMYTSTGEKFKTVSTVDDAGGYRMPYFSEGNLWYGKSRPKAGKERLIVADPKNFPEGTFTPAGESTIIMGKPSKALVESYAGNRRAMVPLQETFDASKFQVYEPNWLRGYKEVKPKKKEEGGWLDKYEQGGLVLKQKKTDNYGTKPNVNDDKATYPDGFVGWEYDITGRNYSPAWGGQFAMGGSIPGAVGFTYARTVGAAPSNGPYAKKTKASAQNGMEMKYYQAGLDFKPKTISQDGTVIDPDGYWNPDNWGKPVIIPSNQITMEDVYEPLVGVSDEGDVQYMEPGKNYVFEGDYVTEYPVAKGGISVNQADAQPIKKLDQLLNFTNYNKPTKGGWLDKYQ